MKIQIIQGCCSTRPRRKGLRDLTMTLDDLLAHGRASEAADRQATEMEQGHPSKKNQPDSVCAFAPNKHQTAQQPSRLARRRPSRSLPTGTCRNCGCSWPHADQPCPARGKTCAKCQKPNHFAIVCRSGEQRQNTRPTRREAVNALDVPDSSSSKRKLTSLPQKRAWRTNSVNSKEKCRYFAVKCKISEPSCATLISS